MKNNEWNKEQYIAFGVNDDGIDNNGEANHKI